AAPAGLEQALDRLAPTPALVVNCAAYTAVDQAEDEVDLAMAVNAGAPAVLAGWAARRAVPILHVSTDYVFDGSESRPWNEEDEPRPLSAYGRSKLAGEAAVRKSGAPHLILRTSWVYASAGRNFLRTIAGLARAKPELRVVADQIGAPTPAEAIADIAAQVIEQHAADLAK